MGKTKFKFQYNDGGRDKSVSNSSWDCLTRAVAIATKTDYNVIADEINMFCDRLKKLHDTLFKDATEEDLSTLFGVSVNKEKADFMKTLFSGEYSSESGVSGFIAKGYLEHKGLIPGQIIKPNLSHTTFPNGTYVLGYEINEIEVGGEIKKIPSAGHFVAFIDGVFHDTNEIMAKRYSKKPILFYWKKEN